VPTEIRNPRDEELRDLLGAVERAARLCRTPLPPFCPEVF
jgi:hypothetical protein